MTQTHDEHRNDSYWACVLARNAELHLRATLDSLLSQSLQPKRVIIVDDGSTDHTAMILIDYADRYPDVVEVLSLPDRGYDIRRVPRNINLGWNRSQAKGLKTDYFMISGDDCQYPEDYARLIASRMTNERRTVVASGRPKSGGSLLEEHSPSGSGRMVRCSFWKEVGARYPVRAGWETWLLYKASERGFEGKVFDDLVFEHFRPRGAEHQFLYWGAAMHALGYHPIYAFGRIAKNLVIRRVAVKGSLNMLRGYVLASLGSSDPFILSFESSLRRFVRAQQSRRMASVARSIVTRRGG